MKKNKSLKNLVTIAMLSAIAAVLMMFDLPIPVIAPPYYKIDFSEVPVLIGTFAMGPLAGVVIEFVKILIEMLFKPTTTAYVGELANFVIGCSMLLPAGIIYWKKKTFQRAVIGLVSGTAVMTVAGCLMNAFVLLPMYAALFMGGMDNIIASGAAVNANITSVATFVIIAVAPFNLIKGVLVSILVLLLYKRISNLLHKI